MSKATATTQVPDAAGRFGPFGGRYVPETLVRALDELSVEYDKACQDAAFQTELASLLKHYVGRPSPLYHAKRLSEECGGAQIWLKREDLNHTGAHKINNTIGQGPAHAAHGQTARDRRNRRRPARRRHRDRLRPFRPRVRRLHGRRGHPPPGAQRLQHEAAGGRSAASLQRLAHAAGRHQRSHARLDGQRRDTHYILGSVVGPHPFPLIVRDFQSVIGRETIEQCREQMGRLPDTVVACVGGGSNAAGMFYPFVEHEKVTLVGVEAGGRSAKPGDHAAPLSHGQPGVLHGSYSYVMQDDDGQTCDVHSMSAGLDYPGVGPEHSYWKDTGRVSYTNCLDADALAAFDALAKSEGILAALESSHAIAKAMEARPRQSRRTTRSSSASPAAATKMRQRSRD